MARKPLIEPGSILPADTMLSRIVARDREKAGRREEASQENLSESQTVSHMTDNMTSHMTDQQEIKPTGKPDSQQTTLSVSKVVSQPSVADDSDDETEATPQTPRPSAASQEATAARKRVGRSPVPSRAEQAEASPMLTASPSLADSIRASLRAPSGEAALKTVTLKMSAALDRKIEDHCYETGRKKQDVIRDAVLLYFEAIEAPE